MTLFRAHREGKLNKRVSAGLTKSMVAKRVIVHVAEEITATVTHVVTEIAVNTFDVVSGQASKRKEEEKKAKQKAAVQVKPIIPEIPSLKKVGKKEQVQLRIQAPVQAETLLSHLTIAELRRVYRHFDSNKDNLVDAEEVKGMMDHATKTYSGMELPTSEIDADFFVKVLDTDGDGVISEEEFVGFMEKYRSFDEEKRQEFANSSGAHLRIGNFAQKMIVVAREKYGVEIGNTFTMDSTSAKIMMDLSLNPTIDIDEVTRTQVQSIMNTYITNINGDTNSNKLGRILNKDDSLRGDYILADLADSLSNFDGEYQNFMNLVQKEMNLVSEQKFDEKRVELLRRRRKTKEKLGREKSTIFGYDQNKNQETIDRQRKATEAMAEIKKLKQEADDRAEQERLEQEQIQKEKKEKIQSEIKEGKELITAMLEMNDIAELTIALDDISDSPPHVINIISKEIEAAKLHLEELKESMSEELKEKILLERIDAAKETLLSNMNDAEKDMEELERNLMNVKLNKEISDSMTEMIADAENLILKLKTNQNRVLEILQTAITTMGDDQLERLESAIQQYDDVKPPFTAEKAIAMNTKGTLLMLRLKELKDLKNLLLKLNQREIAKIKSMNAPIQDIVDIVNAMLILLGTPKNQIKDWKSMRGILGRTGKESLKRKIVSFDVANVSEDAHERSLVLMSGVELDRVTKVSSTGSIFYAFVRGALTMLSGSHEELQEREIGAKKIRELEKTAETERIQKEIYDKAAADRQVEELLNSASLRRSKTKRISIV